MLLVARGASFPARLDYYHEDADVCRVYAADATGLTKREGTYLVEFDGTFPTQSANRHVVNFCGNMYALDMAQFLDLAKLAFQIAAIIDPIKHLKADRFRFGKKLCRQGGDRLAPANARFPKKRPHSRSDSSFATQFSILAFFAIILFNRLIDNKLKFSECLHHPQLGAAMVEREAKLGATGKHAIRLIGALCDQIIDKHTNVTFVAPDDKRRGSS